VTEGKEKGNRKGNSRGRGSGSRQLGKERKKKIRWKKRTIKPSIAMLLPATQHLANTFQTIISNSKH